MKIHPIQSFQILCFSHRGKITTTSIGLQHLIELQAIVILDYVGMF